MPNLTADGGGPDPAPSRPATRVPASILRWKDDRRALGMVIALVGAGVVSSLTFVSPHPPPIIPALLYLLPVALATAVGGRAAGLTGLVASVLLLDSLFLPPIRSWSIGDFTTVGTGRVSGWVVLAVFLVVGAGAVEVIARERDARRRAGAAESRLSLLSESSAVLSQSFDYDKALTSVARFTAASFEGLCLVWLPADGGREERIAAAHADAELDARLQELTPPLSLGAVEEMVSSATPGRSAIVAVTDRFLRTVAGTDANLAVLKRLDTSQWIVAPLVARDTVLGAFAVATSGPADLREADVEAVEDLASRTALAVSGALLFGEEERARKDAVAAAGRTARLQTVTGALASWSSPDEARSLVARESRDTLGAARSAVYEIVPGEGRERVVAASGFSDAELEPFREIAVDADRPPPQSVVFRGVVVAAPATHAGDARSLVADDRYPQDRAAIVAPLRLKGRLTGHLYLGFDQPHVIDVGDLEMLGALVGICAQVLDRALLVEQERAARDAAEQSALRLSIVSRASALLAVELDYPRAYARLADLLVEQIADLCLIDVTEGGTIRRVAASHADPARRPEVEALRDRYPPTPNGKHPVARVLRTGQPEVSPYMTDQFIHDTTRDDEHLRIVRDLGFQSFMCVPLAARGRILGTITLVSTNSRRRYGDADLAVAQEVARRAAVRIDNARLYAAEQDARRGAEAAAILSSSLSEAVSLEEVLDVVSHGMRDALGAANSTVVLLDGTGEQLEVVRRLGTYAIRADEWTSFRVDADLPLSEAVRSAQPVLIASEEERKRRYPLLAQLDSPFDHSLICLPLQVEGRPIGGIALGYPDVRGISADDTRVAMTLAGQSAQALRRARLYETEQGSRLEAERARERLSFLADASRLLSSSLDWNLTLSRLAHLAVPNIADWCAVDVVDEVASIRRLVVAHADPRKGATARRMELRYPADPEANTSAARVISSGTSELVPDVAAQPFQETRDPEVQETLAELGLSSVMVVPLPARGKIVGAITFALTGGDRQFGNEDLELAEDLARRAGVAVDNARLYQERDRVAHTLQQSLLPQRIPSVPGMEFEGRYHALGSGNDVGGDFYDVFDSGNGSWGMTIGDVCGKGPEAAAVMGVVRYTLRAAAMHEDRPSSLLSSLNEALRQHLLDERFCTVAYARIRPGNGTARLTVCLAGHLPLVVLRADGRVERVGRPGTILGVLPDLSLTDVTVDLAAGDAVVLFTDGVTDERRGEEIGGEAGLVRALEGLRGATAADIASALDRLITDPRWGPARDDAAILVARVIPGEADMVASEP
jgi:GAF domain-containing protein